MHVGPPSDSQRGILDEELAFVRRVGGDPDDGPPFFAHLRVQTGGRIRDVLLAARTHIDDDIALVDWERAPLARVFFECRTGDEYEIEAEGRTLTGVVIARRLLAFEGGMLVEVEDDDARLVCDPRGEWHACEPTSFAGSLRARKQPPGAGEIVLDATQRAAVELPADRSAVVLGEAGFGKTTVALHRLRWLAERARASDTRWRALVLVPTEALRRLSLLWLGRLGVPEVEVDTYEHWVAEQTWRVFPDLPRRLAVDRNPRVIRLKRHPALREVFGDLVAGTAAMKAVERGYQESTSSRDVLLHLFGDRDLLARVVADSDGRLLPGDIAATVAHTRTQFTDTTERANAHVDADRLRTLDGRSIDEGTPMQDAETIDVEDCAVLLELQRRKTGKMASPRGALQRYDHVVVDEAQELAPLELNVVGRAVERGGALTIAGDERQSVDDAVSFAGWPVVMRELAVADFTEVVLTESYRCPPGVEALARAVVGRGGTEREQGGAAPIVWIAGGNACRLTARLVLALSEIREHDRRSTVAVICRHREVAIRTYANLTRTPQLAPRLALDGDFDFRPGILVTCVEEVRGLEFDHVVLPDVSTASYSDDDGARRALYLAMTRTMHQLWLGTPGRWSSLVRAHVPADAWAQTGC